MRALAAADAVVDAAVDILRIHAINGAVEQVPDSPKKEKSAFRESAASVVHAAGTDN